MNTHKKTRTIYTIGHSTRPFGEFVEALKNFDINTVADVRSYPGSRKYPQYNKESLQETLPAEGIHYIHLPLLGGRRKMHLDSQNNAWRHPAFRGYADYMETEEFHQGIQRLTEIAAGQRVAYMCSEAVWWRCHRSLISDYLKIYRWRVMHIMSKDKEQEHPFTSAAQVENDHLTYHLKE